ncbi:RNA degradosome polyphosphate kinase [Oribacterium sp. C9]|uniref:RNA degradosome polyphosphate kinase n=1 Tax=Oribacterium sp. C9 TaxID=1943579 RepID=UPI00098F47E4|nr:RNA degradosome polyphosphate kinase [Oribacterium sp. C9]OON87958.1 RNA degradosome polyphosphate kinase [Oribacterium sp. C9]
MTVNIKNVFDPVNFTNRELSWLDFDARCLYEARDHSEPLFERLKFLSITASNLDEFFTVRVASLKDQVNAGYQKKDIAGMTPQQQLAAISEKTHSFMNLQYSTYNRSILPSLRNQGLYVISEHEKLTEEEAKFVDEYFKNNVYPVLTPFAVDSGRPFPLVLNRTLNIAALVKPKKIKGKSIVSKKHKKAAGLDMPQSNIEFAMVQVPNTLPRIVELPTEALESGKTQRVVILLEEIIERNMGLLFANYEIVSTHIFRIMRNADLSIDEEEATDLLEEIKKQLKQRRWGEVVRLEVEDTMDKRLLKVLRKELGIENKEDVYRINGPLDLTFLMKMYKMEGFDYLKTPDYVPQPVPALHDGGSIFECIRRKDIFETVPYETFDPVVRLIKDASRDPETLAIKITLYRVSGNSPIVKALEEAAINGKDVTVLVELKARFDEENNIQWAERLEKAGCHVIYGLVGLKTHSKIALVIRNEADGIRRYVHLATGNYNDSTAKQYTDLGIFTCEPEFGEDATNFFNMISGYSEPENWKELILAPLWLRKWVLKKIRKEIENAKKGVPAKITAKMNSLCDPEVIGTLYEASQAGVQIDLIVRGICCLRAGIPKLSENIQVRSIVGYFLEHARIFRFENGGEPEYYLGSADWMPRNLDRRIEIVFPVHDADIRKRLQHILDLELADNVKASVMDENGEYHHADLRGRKQINSQIIQCEEALKQTKKLTKAKDAEKKMFIPRGHKDIGD